MYYVISKYMNNLMDSVQQKGECNDSLVDFSIELHKSEHKSFLNQMSSHCYCYCCSNVLSFEFVFCAVVKQISFNNVCSIII